MKKLYTFLVVIFLTITIFPQSNFYDFINRVNSVGDPARKTTIIDSFLTFARTKGIPFIEGDTANFIYRGSAT